MLGTSCEAKRRKEKKRNILPKTKSDTKILTCKIKGLCSGNLYTNKAPHVV